MEEIFDIYTRDGKYLGTKEKSICHGPNPGFYHKPALIWIIDDNKKTLVQKRAACKKNYPNLWDLGCAGHIDAGETPIEGAIRETYEELGINATAEDYKFICEFVFDSTWEIGETFLLKYNERMGSIKLKEDEVSEVKWITFDEFEKLLYSDDFVPFEEEYKKLIIKKLGKILK